MAVEDLRKSIGLGLTGKEFSTGRKAARVGEGGLKSGTLKDRASRSSSRQISFIFSSAFANAATEGANQPFFDAVMNPVVGAAALVVGTAEAAANFAVRKPIWGTAGSGSNHEV
jgi:hypothetical protein